MKSALTLAIVTFVSLSAFSPVARERERAGRLQFDGLAGLQDPLEGAGGYATNRQCNTEMQCVPNPTKACRSEVIELEGDDPVVTCTDIVM